jgi:hypothetical protein
MSKMRNQKRNLRARQLDNLCRYLQEYGLLSNNNLSQIHRAAVTGAVLMGERERADNDHARRCCETFRYQRLEANQNARTPLR